MANVTEQKSSILIIDDESFVRNLLNQILSERYSCSTAGSAEEALSLIRSESFDLIISDINLGGMSGIELIPQVAELAPDTVIMVISGDQTIDSAIQAIRSGAFDYIQKPFDLKHVGVAVDRALEHHSLLSEKRRYDDHLEELVKKRTEELNYLSYYDMLTDLPNRTLFEDRLSQALVLVQDGQRVALLFVSLDGFKKVRDTIGQVAGNEILQEVAKRLLGEVPEGATVARFEGDEFAVLLIQIAGMEEVAEITGAITRSLKQPIATGDTEIFIATSIGVSLFPDDGKDTHGLLKNAGAALLRAQESGGDSYQFYTPGMNTSALKRLSFENNLRHALNRGELQMYYQPKLDILTRNILGMEGLVRWRHPELGMVSPAEFIPIAEDTGLIVPIGEWILYTACNESKAWNELGFDLHLSVNLSARQFQQQDLAKRILAIVKAAGFDPRRLDLEVTESAIMKNAEFAIQTLSILQETGIKISIDDFGTGYSSLGYLKRLPIDILKIDKSFIDDVTTNADDAALVVAIITLAHNLRLKVVAEGVETEDQLKFLQLLKCDEWQGYLFSKPVPAEEFGKLLMTQRAVGGV